MVMSEFFAMLHMEIHVCSTDKEAVETWRHHLSVWCVGVLPDIGSLAMQRMLGRGMTINCCKVSCSGGGGEGLVRRTEKKNIFQFHSHNDNCALSTRNCPSAAHKIMNVGHSSNISTFISNRFWFYLFIYFFAFEILPWQFKICHPVHFFSVQLR